MKQSGCVTVHEQQKPVKNMRKLIYPLGKTVL